MADSALHPRPSPIIKNARDKNSYLYCCRFDSMVTWKLKHFIELRPDELYDMLALRSEIFVVEQNCVYLDLDYKDKTAYHLTANTREKTIACARILAPGISYPEASIGRVCCHRRFREIGLGKELMRRAIDACVMIYPKHAIRISAQVYLQKFYEDLGFQAKGAKYLEDEIEHIEMLLK